MPTHHLYAFGHNPYRKLVPHITSPTIHEPTDVIQPCWRDLARIRYGVEELAAEYVWGDYGSTLIRLFDGSRKRSWNQYIFLGFPPDGLLSEYIADGGLAEEWDIPQDGGADRCKPTTITETPKNQNPSTPGSPPEPLEPRSQQQLRSITPLKDLPEKIKIIGFDKPEGWLDPSTGQVRRLTQDLAGGVVAADGGATEPRTDRREGEEAAAGVTEAGPQEPELKARTESRVHERRYKDIACLVDGTIYALPILFTTDGPGLYEYDSLTDLLEANATTPPEGQQGSTTRGTFVPLPLPPNTNPGGISLHGGTSHLLVWAKEPCSQAFGLGDNRFYSATPFPLSAVNRKGRSGHVEFPDEIEELSGIPLVGVWAGEMCSGAVSQGGEAWVWGKRVGPGRLERVDVTVKSDGQPDDNEEDCSGDVRLLALGEGHEMVVLDDDRAYVRGTNEYGQLGLAAPPRGADWNPFEDDDESQPSHPEWTAHPFFNGEGLKVQDVWTKDWAGWVRCVRD